MNETNPWCWLRVEACLLRKTALARRLEVRPARGATLVQASQQGQLAGGRVDAFGTMLRDSEDANGDAVIGLDDQVSSNRP
jgi:hypothetical protein